jgi:hypothetical protein
MANGKHFLLDANIFIEAKRRYYAFDLCPGFWEALIWQQRGNRIKSIDRVKRELEAGGNDLGIWVSTSMPDSCFASTNDTDVAAHYGRMVTWVQSQVQFTAEARAHFAAAADGWLIAYAKTYDCVLVTHETFAPEVRRTVPIPNVCQSFGVEYVDTFQMLRELRVVFAWTPPS